MSNTHYSMKVADITQETADAVTLHLEHPERNSISFIPGQFLTLIIPVNGSKIRRSYSLCSTPDDPRLSVTIKRVEGGLMSNYILDNVKVGQEIEVMAPLGNFNLKADASKKRHIYLFGGGSGITPLMSMTRTILKDEPQSRLTLIYGNRNENSVIFKSEFDRLEQENPERLKVLYVYNESLKDATEQQEENIGLLDRMMVIKLMEKCKAPGYSDESFYMCGPEGMMNEVRDALQFMKVPADRVFKESFVAPTTPEDKNVTGANETDEIVTQTVTIIYEGKEYKVEVKPNETILEAGLRDDIDLPYSCQAGLCTACRGKCLTGRVHLDEREGLSDSEIAQGYVLNCVGHPLTSDVVIEIG